MKIRLFVFIAILMFPAFSCSSQGGGDSTNGDSDEDNSWPFHPDGDDNIPGYECNADVDCNNPAYKCEDHFCVPRYLPDGDEDGENEAEVSDWPCGLDCSKLPNTFKAHCGSQGDCIIEECWPGYDNCDDEFENGCEQEVYTNMDNCGICLRKCQLKNASEKCSEGECLIVACEGEYQDADGIDSNGCECIDSGSDVFGDGADTDCDGIDGQIENFIFVSEDGTGDGSKEDPLGDIQEAIDMAGENQIVAVSTGDYPGPLTLREGISVYGGWDVNFRARAYENQVNVITGTYLNQENEALPMNFAGLYAEGIRSKTNIEILSIYVEDNISPSGSNIGMWIADCSYGLSFNHVTVETGTGGNGVSGSDGRSGRKGIQGQQGQPGCENDSNFFCTDSNCANPQGGRGGDSPCGNDGGVGGKSGLGNDDGQDFSGSDGGEGAGGTPGGAGGIGANNLTDDFECECEGCSSCVWTNGEQGKHGNRGLTGTPGASGQSEGEIVDGMWYATPAGNGGRGQCGPGGGGGGGGGGGRCGATHDCKRFGSAGSGGGGGGEGGTGGTAGTGGGASIGVFLLAASPDIRESAIISGDGGTGGNGGIGGSGGEGGEGGPDPEFGSNQRSGGCGGAGGDGGAGGNGGDGGGGAGGPSWGFYLLENSMPNVVDTEVIHGDGGEGGTGGNNGEVGASGDMFIEEQEIEEGDGDEELDMEIEYEAEFEPEFEFEEEYEPEAEFEESDGDIDSDLEAEDELDADLIDYEYELESEEEEYEIDVEPELEPDPDPDPDEEDLFSANPDRDMDFDREKDSDFDFDRPK